MNLYFFFACFTILLPQGLTTDPSIEGFQPFSISRIQTARDTDFVNFTKLVETWVAGKAQLEDQNVTWWSTFGNDFINATTRVTPLIETWNSATDLDDIKDTLNDSNAIAQQVYWFHNNQTSNASCSFSDSKFPVSWYASNWTRNSVLVIESPMVYTVPRSPKVPSQFNHFAEFAESNNVAITGYAIATTLHNSYSQTHILLPKTSLKWEIFYPRRYLVHRWNIQFCFKGKVAVQYENETNVTLYPVSLLADNDQFVYNATIDCLVYTEEGSFTANDTISTFWTRRTEYPILSNATDSGCTSSSTNIRMIPGFLATTLLISLIFSS